MAPVANGIVRFDRLSPGRWAALLVKQVEGDGYCFGLAMETISAGQTLSSELRWQERPPPQIFGIHGTITISPGWEKVASEAPWIARLHRDEIDASEGSDGTFSHGPESELVPTDDPLRFRFDFGRKARGHYQMLIPRVGAVLTLVADHERERAWTVPPPIEMELTLLAARGDRPVTDRRVVWAMASAGRELREVGVPIEPDLEDGRFRFVVPGGTFLIHASVFGDHFGGRTAFFEAKPESNRITLRLPRERDVEVEISLRDGPRALAETSNAKLRIERDGKPVTFPYSCPLNGTSITPRLPGPGRYRLFVSGVAGYDDPPPLDFEVDGRGIRKLDVPMRRRA
jgi:hypothetical protein